MFSANALRSIHERTHRNLAGLLSHCRSLSEEELNRKMDGFGYPTVRLQLHHVLSAEKYWIGVLEGRIDADEDDPLYPTIESLEAYREKIFSMTDAHLRTATPEELGTPRSMATWGGREHVLTPAHVFIRTQVHAYHHQGQILAICRLMGKPGGGLDYPHE